MEKITTVLFDLDGTLLPMDQDLFVKSYFGKLAEKMAPRGYDPDGLIKAVWGGTAAWYRTAGNLPTKRYSGTFSAASTVRRP